MKCHYCPTTEDLRPYGPNGAWVCFECAMKPENKAETERQFNAQLNADRPGGYLRGNPGNPGRGLLRLRRLEGAGHRPPGTPGREGGLMKSPCINVCRLAEDRCEGCARTREEIAKWSKMSDRERDAIMDRLRLDFLRKVDEFLWTLQMTRLPEGSVHYTEAEALRDRARGLLAVEPDPEDALRDAAGERLRAMGYDLDELDRDNPYNAED